MFGVLPVALYLTPALISPQVFPETPGRVVQLTVAFIKNVFHLVTLFGKVEVNIPGYGVVRLTVNVMLYAITFTTLELTFVVELTNWHWTK